MKILVTGCAGFIGYHLTKRLLEECHEVVGIDNINDLLYSGNLKRKRLANLLDMKKEIKNKFIFYKIDISDNSSIVSLFQDYSFSKVIHLAAIPGVRYSFKNPTAYIQSNINGFYNIIMAAATQGKYKYRQGVKHFIYASSSSVYGQTGSEYFKEYERTDTPCSLYAATKKCNEILEYALSYMYDLPCIGLRFFTVYGPWGRPDMAYYLFADKISRGEPITVYGDSDIARDFTYIDDIIDGLMAVVYDTSCSGGVYNIGRGQPVNLRRFISIIENKLGKLALKIYKPLPLGDVTRTSADTTLFNSLFNFKPRVSIDEGIEKFIHWYKEYTGVNYEN